jgi:hypothetical protein
LGRAVLQFDIFSLEERHQADWLTAGFFLAVFMSPPISILYSQYRTHETPFTFSHCAPTNRSRPRLNAIWWGLAGRLKSITLKKIVPEHIERRNVTLFHSRPARL